MIEIPEKINMAQFYLDRNLELNRADKTAVYCKDKTYSYTQLVSFSNRVGNFLKTLGVEVEDRVLMVINDSPEFVASWYGIIKIGAVATDVYSYLRAKDYDYFFNYTRAKVAIVDADALPRMESVLGNSKKWWKWPQTIWRSSKPMPTMWPSGSLPPAAQDNPKAFN